MKSIASVFLMIFLYGTTANANVDNQGYCRNAQTTADSVECIKTHQEASSKIMDSLFLNLKTIKYNHFEATEKNQEEWIKYRNTTCQIEGKTYEGGSLEQVQRAQCLVRMTDNRNIHLRNLLEGQDISNIPEYSNPPRWVNVLVRDYPDMFWGFGSAKKIDSDCDGQDENIIRGLSENNVMVLAIADSEKTGRPKITIIDFNDSQNCGVTSDIEIERFPEPKPSDEESLTCMQSLKIKTKSCGDFAIHYNSTDKEYSLKK